MAKHTLNLLWMYPDLMSIYGDRGNIITLQKRSLWRGIDMQLISHTVGSPKEELRKADLIFMGGAQDRQQKLVSRDLLAKKDLLKSKMNAGVPGLFICGAYQFLGDYYKASDGETIPGLSLFQMHTVHFGSEKPRAIGNLVIKWNNTTVVGFENHGGRSYLKDKANALGLVIKGTGNNGEDQTEGIIFHNSIGCYLHGPVLPKNPHLADWLIQKALNVKYQQKVTLSPLENSLENKTRKVLLHRLNIIE